MQRHRTTQITAARSMGAPFLRHVATLPEKIRSHQVPVQRSRVLLWNRLAFRTTSASSSARTAAGSPRCWKRSPSAADSTPRVATAIIIAKPPRRSELAQALRLSWLPKVTEGFLCGRELLQLRDIHRAGSDLRAYGGKSLHAQSHGESFLSCHPSVRAGDLHTRRARGRAVSATPAVVPEDRP